jgi:DHA2 family methylenomycin A resistance protein-like MFS transporter
MPAIAFQHRRVLAATVLSYVVVILDASIVNVALGRIGAAFGTGVTGLEWVVNAYTLSFASPLLSGGGLGDRLGARRIYFAGLGLFTVASALCGIAPTLPALVTFRILQGAGAALLVPCSLSLINHAFPDPARRAGAIGLWAGLGGIAMAAGPLVGGVLTGLFGWRGIFLVNVPVELIGLGLTARIEGDTTTVPGRHFDLAGQASAIAALGLSVAALIEGPALGWDSAFVRAACLGAGAVWAIFLGLEARRTEPMLPLAFFKGRVFSAAAVVSMVSALTFYGLVFVLSLYLQRVRGLSPLWTGIAFLPLTALVAVGSLLSGFAVRKQAARRTVTAAFVVYVAGFVGLIAAMRGGADGLAALSMPLIGLAAGCITPAATGAMMQTVEKDRAGIAAGVLNAARQSGAALGVAIFGALIAAPGSGCGSRRRRPWVPRRPQWRTNSAPPNRSGQTSIR